MKSVNYFGRVVLFRDVTEQERRKRQLEQQNEQLEEFAGIVSHDLRNPLNVARGRIEMVEDEQAQVIERNLDRMESIIDDTLTLARQGQRIETTEPVDLAALCRDVWATVDTGDATAEFAVDRTVEGDPGRLRHVFENLFRNAVEHGSTNPGTQDHDGAEHGQRLTITVGDLDDGFYVEDDGEGIPEDERETVLEKGYTTADDGTGFGLSIVKTAVEAHGWTVTVTESDAGGARFEVRGVGEDVATAD